MTYVDIPCEHESVLALCVRLVSPWAQVQGLFRRLVCAGLRRLPQLMVFDASGNKIAKVDENVGHLSLLKVGNACAMVG